MDVKRLVHVVKEIERVERELASLRDTSRRLECSSAAGLEPRGKNNGRVFGEHRGQRQKY